MLRSRRRTSRPAGSACHTRHTGRQGRRRIGRRIGGRRGCRGLQERQRIVHRLACGYYHNGRKGRNERQSMETDTVAGFGTENKAADAGSSEGGAITVQP